MELYLLHPVEFQLLYNCTNINIDSVALAERTHTIEGVIMIVLSTFYYILYIPCTLSICKHLDLTVYRLLLWISITDMGILWVLGFAHGILAIQGAVFCSSPNFIYICGLFIRFFWLSESTCEMVLVFNRCLTTLSPRIEKALFGGWRVFIWIFVTIANGFYWWWFQKVVLFNGLNFTWLFNPYAGYINDQKGKYIVPLHIYWNMCVAIAIPLMYIIFAIAFRIQMAAFRDAKSVSKGEKMLFLQVFLISVFNFVAGSTFSYINWKLPSEWIVHFAMFSWLQIHGFPPVIYLVLNKTIQKDTYKMIFWIYCKITGRTTTASVSVSSFRTVIISRQ